ncbi:MAG: hypothetical protein EOP11_12355 [Proteobacteria bacterium]|nr:MAG: hypothetical protein EOP11_12355 [Pseudomonadota bacterium]
MRAILLKKFSRIFRSQAGDTLVSVIMAAGLLGAAAVGGGSIVKLMRQGSSLSNSSGTAIAFESQIMFSLQNKETFTPAIAESLRKGGAGAAEALPIRDNAGLVVADASRRLTFDERGRACSPTAANPCALATQLAISCATGACRAAYQIEFIPGPAGTLPMAPIGARAWPPAEEDFSLVIGYDLYRRTDTVTSCLPDELFVTSLDRTSGSVICVKPANRKLGANEIGKTVEYDIVTNSIELTRQPLKKISCPQDYVMMSLDPRSLEGTGSGTCVYRYKRSVPWMETWPSGMEYVSGPMCPQQNYAVDPAGACVGTPIPGSAVKGYCPKVCQDGTGLWYDCSYEVDPVLTSAVTQSISGPNVTCEFVYPSQPKCDDGRPSGASFRGQVAWGGTCRLTAPLTVPAN